MAYGHDLKCPTNAFAPAPVGFCQRCNTKRYRHDLVKQFDQRGASVAWIGIWVCRDRCLDDVATTLRPIIIRGPEGTIRDPLIQSIQEITGGQTLPTFPNFPMQFALEGDDQQTFLGDEDKGFEVGDEDSGASIIPESGAPDITLSDEDTQADLKDEALDDLLGPEADPRDNPDAPSGNSGDAEPN